MPNESKLSRRKLLLGTTSAALAAAAVPALAMPRRFPVLRGGHSSGGAPPPVVGGTITTFQIVEHSGVSSLGYKRMGLPIVTGDVPAGSRLKVQRGGVDIAAQFDARMTKSGNLRLCVPKIRDTSFSANESRTYSVIVEAGAFDNTSTMTLSTALAGTDFKVDFTSIVGSTSGSIANHTASLNTHAAVATRVTQYEKGPVCDSWKIWGMAVNGATPHAHLKVNWYFTVWKDAGGSIVDYEIAAEPALDWWSIAGKEKLTYVATLKNSTTVIQAYGGAITDSGGTRAATVGHCYHSRWLTARLQNDNEHGSRHWINNPRPTLLYKPNQSYWIATKLVPPLNMATAYTVPAGFKTGAFQAGYFAAYTYQPVEPQGHRPSIDDTGPYPGRGSMTEMDCMAFTTQVADDVRMMRVNAFSGIHVPYHYRSNNLRTRSGESADTANTIISLILWDERGSGGTPSSFYDFTAAGMPAAVHAYFGTGTPSGFADSFVASTGGTADWAISGDSSHSPNFSYYAYLFEGERYFLEAILDLGMNVVHQKTGTEVGSITALLGVNPNTGVAVYPGTPTTLWAGIAPHAYNNERSVGWASNNLSAMSLVPDDDPQSGFVTRLVANNAKWVKQSLDYAPSNANGVWNPMGQFYTSSWMETMSGVSFYSAYDRTGDANWLAAAEWQAMIIIRFGEVNQIAGTRGFHMMVTPRNDIAWNASTNPFYDPIMQEYGPATISSSTNIITCDPTSNTAGLQIGWTAGDEIVGNDLPTGVVPAELLPSSTIFYVVNPTLTGFQLATTPGGTPITFGSNYTNVWLGRRGASYAQTTPEKVINPDTPGGYARALAVMAIRHSHPRMTTTIGNKFMTYYAGMDNSSSAAWNFSTTS
jgi:hypothetical protein